MTSSRETRELAANYVEASYQDHPNPEYHGNRLISALPFFLTDSDLLEALELLPEFHESERDESAAVRQTFIGRLSRMLIVIPRTIHGVQSFLHLLLEGYVGREPFGREHRAKLQAIYEARKQGKPLSSLPDAKVKRTRRVGAELSTAFIGASGAGKTTLLNHLAELLPPVIKHSDMWQVPILIFEMPPDGRTEHGLATAIIDALHRKLPYASYADLYLRNVNNKNAFERIYDAASLLEIHGVGLLIADESSKQQKVDKHAKNVLDAAPNATAGGSRPAKLTTPLISLLITASNKLGVPLVLTGTNEVYDVLRGSFSKKRRATGHGMQFWGFLTSSGSFSEPGEFEAFLRRIWKFQWVKKPVKLSNARAQQFFELTQGNPDIIVKLFASSQRRAIREGIEELTPEVIQETFDKEFTAVQRPLKAHGDADAAELVKYLDIAPTDLRPGAEFSAAAERLNRQHYEKLKKKKETKSPADAAAASPQLELPLDLDATNLADIARAARKEKTTVEQLKKAGFVGANHQAVK